jgi:hypothetical protein
MKDNPLVLSPAVEWGFFFWGMICSRAASGHAAAAPPSSVMNSRRFMLDMGIPPRAVGLPRPQPSTRQPAGPLGDPESF